MSDSEWKLATFEIEVYEESILDEVSDLGENEDVQLFYRSSGGAIEGMNFIESHLGSQIGPEDTTASNVGSRTPEDFEKDEIIREEDTYFVAVPGYSTQHKSTDRSAQKGPLPAIRSDFPLNDLQENSGQNDTTSSPQNQSTNEQGGDDYMTDYQGRDFWADVKRGMEDLDDDLEDLAGYVESGDFDQVVDTIETAANQVGGYDEARNTAESFANYLEAVQQDVSDVHDDLEVHKQTLEQVAQDLENVGWRQDEVQSMNGIQNYVANR